MFSPRPYGLFVPGGGELAQEDLAAVDANVRRLSNLQEAGGLPSMKMVRALPGGGSVVVQSVGGVLRAIVQQPVEAPQAVTDTTAKGYIPMLFAGVVTAATIKPDAGVGLRLSRQTRRRLAGYPEDEVNLPAQDQTLRRFAISYNTIVSELDPTTSGGGSAEVVYTQYARQRPTWYSGAMAEVMQIVGGYGRQDLANLPRTSKVEQARMVLPANVMAAISRELGDTRLPGYSGEPPESGQFQYDYKFDQTHGVGFDDDGNPWLLRLKSGGLHAMPLPIVPATTTKAFRAYMEKAGDDEILAILDRFGGMPSGESFPGVSGAFEAWQRAGVIIKVCDVSGFYTHTAYSTACGWSFNSKGTEAFNTCYDYDEDASGLGYGLAYALRISYGKADYNGRLPPNLEYADAQDRAVVTAYLADLYKLMGANLASNATTGSSASTSATGISYSGTGGSSSTSTGGSDASLASRYEAIKYKWRRHSAQELLARARATQTVTAGELDYWDNLEMDPIAGIAGSMSQVGRGWLYHRAKFLYQPQIKFPEPSLGGCVSHDFLPMIGSGGSPGCDTIMYGYYIGDQLKVVKYFYDPNSSSTTPENNFEDCMIVGAWTETVYNTTRGPMGFFYTTDFDDRLSAADTTTVTNIVGKDLGYDTTPRFAYDGFFYRIGTIWRERHYQHTTTTTKTTGYSMDLAVCVPYLCRNAVLYARREVTTGASTEQSVALGSVTDPWTYRFWTWDFVFRWMGTIEVMNGDPYPKDENPVWVTMESYSPGGCSDFADQGSWIPGLPADYTWLVHPQANVHAENGGGSSPAVKEYSKTTEQPGTDTRALKLSFATQPQTVAVTPENWYWYGSPDDSGSLMYRDASRVVFGNATYANVSEADSSGVRQRWGYTVLADHRSAHHFIGVINE